MPKGPRLARLSSSAAAVLLLACVLRLCVRHESRWEVVATAQSLQHTYNTVSAQRIDNQKPTFCHATTWQSRGVDSNAGHTHQHRTTSTTRSRVTFKFSKFSSPAHNGQGRLCVGTGPGDENCMHTHTLFHKRRCQAHLSQKKVVGQNTARSC